MQNVISNKQLSPFLLLTSYFLLKKPEVTL